jgi:hypothetical protein
MNKKTHIAILVVCILIFWISKDIGFFWDNSTIGYKMTNHLYTNGLFNFNFPVSCDGATPPLYPLLNAISWMIFGKQVSTSHLIQILFVYGLFIQIYNFAKHYTNNSKSAIFVSFLMFVDPTLDAQIVLIGPELIMIFLFFLALNGVLKNNLFITTIGLLFLSLIHLRGMILCSGLFLFDVIRHLYLKEKTFINFIKSHKITPYLIGSIIPITYLIWRYITRGWLITHPDSPWKGLWTLTDLPNFIRNMIVLLHRYLDFGRISIFLVILVLFIQFKKKLFSKEITELFLLGVLPVSIIILVSLLSNNPLGHRYLVVSYLVFIMISYKIIEQHVRLKKTLYSIVILTLITGNLWVYPKHIAQGWDASLAHIPYFKLRTKAIQYLDTDNIPIEKVSTFFPNRGKIDMVDLSGDLRSFSDTFTGNEEYVFYSNVFNLSDKDYYILENNYHLTKRFEKALVHVDILKRNH